MARTTSAKKAHRGSLKKRARNTGQLARTDRLIRLYRRAETVSQNEWQDVQQALDKGAKTGLFHPGKVNRLKSRLAKRLTSPTLTRSVAKRATKKRVVKKRTTKK